MKAKVSVLRRMTTSVAALVLVSALVGRYPVANAAEVSTPAWQEAIAALPVPGQGCFTASFPAVQWQSTACSSVHPKIAQQFAGPSPNEDGANAVPQQVAGCAGNSCDFAAQTASPMTAAEGSFPSVTCASSPCESGQFGNAGAAGNNIYSLQLNTNFNLPATSSCSTALVPSACTGWQQFVYDSDLKEIQVEPALLGYDNTCTGTFNTPDGAGNCYDENENTASVPQLTPQQLMSDSVKFVGQVGLVNGTETDTVKMIVSGTSSAATAADNLVNLAGNWTDAQFGLYGDRGGGEANFIAGTDMRSTSSLTAGPRRPHSACRSTRRENQTTCSYNPLRHSGRHRPRRWNLTRTAMRPRRRPHAPRPTASVTPTWIPSTSCSTISRRRVTTNLSARVRHHHRGPA